MESVNDIAGSRALRLCALHKAGVEVLGSAGVVFARMRSDVGLRLWPSCNAVVGRELLGMGGLVGYRPLPFHSVPSLQEIAWIVGVGEDRQLGGFLERPDCRGVPKVRVPAE